MMLSLRRVSSRPLETLRRSPFRGLCATANPAGGDGKSPDQGSLEKEYSKEISDVMTTYEEHSKRKQFMIGRVISNKAAKSITVAVQRRKFVPKYNSYQRWTKKVMAHDEVEECHVGDIVRIIPCQPKSKKKRHRVCDILFRETQIEVSKDSI